MQTLIDKIQLLEVDTDIPTVGYKTLLVALENGASGAAKFAGTKAEAEALKKEITVKVSDTAADANPETLDAQYIQVRTIANSVHAMLEVVLTKAYVTSLTLPADYDTLAEFLTLPSNSEAASNG